MLSGLIREGQPEDVRKNSFHFIQDLQFEYLKQGYEENSLSSKQYKQIWIPNIQFDDVDINSDTVVYEKTVFVKRKGLPIVSGEVDNIDVRELYDGKENPINIDFEKRIKFTCYFDNIKNYPFGMQDCGLYYYISGADNLLTKLNPVELIDEGPKVSLLSMIT